MELPLYSPDPKSAWIPIDVPIKLMSAFEFVSTADAETFSFQALFAGKGTNPFRFAPCPTLIPLQTLAWVLPCTTRLIEDELLAPGFGLLTVTANVPEVVWLPEAVSCVALTNVVLKGAPDRATCAPFTKLLPVTTSVKLPALNVDGIMSLRIGVGLSSVTFALVLAVASAELVAATATVLGFGNVRGAV